MVYEALGETLMMNFVVAFLELWLGMADVHEHPLSYGLDWCVLWCECVSCDSYGWVQENCPLRR